MNRIDKVKEILQKQLEANREELKDPTIGPRYENYLKGLVTGLDYSLKIIEIYLGGVKD